MELSIEQVLQQGVTAHKAGKHQDAEKLYRAILSSQPNHPDANHNLGVIAVSVKKSDAALPLFKTALEANPKVEQFWLSYIDALIKGKQLGNAKEVLQRGKASGLNGEKIDRLEEQLNGTVSSSPSLTRNNNPSQQQIDELIRLYTQGKLQEAVIQGTALANQFPSEPAIPNILGAIYAGLGRYKEAITNYNKAIELKPDYAEAYNNRGNALNKLGENEEATYSYYKALKLDPKYVEAHNKRDLEAIDSMNADDFEGRAANGIIVKGPEAHAAFLKEWFATSNPSWKFNYALANDVLLADGTHQHWVTSAYTLTDTANGEEVVTEEFFDVEIENGKIKLIMVASRVVIAEE